MTSLPPLQIRTSYLLLEQPPLYSIGTFSEGVTVWRQQVRALNLAWSLIEDGKLNTPSTIPLRIAVVGAGFSGLTFAAALLKKAINCHITLFEEHDTLLPLQHGSDTRWLHPHIYDWPDKGSDADVAMLPILNWTAARASDVAVQVLDGWRQIVESRPPHTCPSLRLFCNTRHLRITPDTTDCTKSRLEWVGDPREPIDGTTSASNPSTEGSAAQFDLVILAVGFGIEQGTYSYWRNETIGQPLLHQSRRTYLISGQGDGAAIDLIRARLSQYRQDRILDELFSDKPGILSELQKAKQQFDNIPDLSLFDIFDKIFNGDALYCQERKALFLTIAKRVRRDTDAILRTKVPDLATLLHRNTSRISFQNSLLVYLLYRVGAFAPSNAPERHVLAKYSIDKTFWIKRHGTNRLNQIVRLLSKDMLDQISDHHVPDKNCDARLGEVNWEGGYFDFPGPLSKRDSIEDDLRQSWRREYLPGPTTLIAAALCGAVVGTIKGLRANIGHLRVTLHRVLYLNNEKLLQQACDYQGVDVAFGDATAGRTFPAENAMIGLAYRSHRPVHAKQSASGRKLEAIMKDLGLMEAARRMAPNVSYVLAIPLLQPKTRYFSPSRVAAVVYLDSRDEEFALSFDEIRTVSNVVEGSIESLNTQSDGRLLGVRNVPFQRVEHVPQDPKEVRGEIGEAIEILPEELTPRLSEPLVINFDYADPTALRVTSREKTIG